MENVSTSAQESSTEVRIAFSVELGPVPQGPSENRHFPSSARVRIGQDDVFTRELSAAEIRQIRQDAMKQYWDFFESMEHHAKALGGTFSRGDRQGVRARRDAQGIPGKGGGEPVNNVDGGAFLPGVVTGIVALSKPAIAVALLKVAKDLIVPWLKARANRKATIACGQFKIQVSDVRDLDAAVQALGALSEKTGAQKRRAPQKAKRRVPKNALGSPSRPKRKT